jgi:hypothetical protein
MIVPPVVSAVRNDQLCVTWWSYHGRVLLSNGLCGWFACQPSFHWFLGCPVIWWFLCFSLSHTHSLSLSLCPSSYVLINLVSLICWLWLLTTSLVITRVFTILGHNDKGVNDKSHCYPLCTRTSGWPKCVCVCQCVCMCEPHSLHVGVCVCMCIVWRLCMCVHCCVLTVMCVHMQHNLHNSPKF